MIGAKVFSPSQNRNEKVLPLGLQTVLHKRDIHDYILRRCHPKPSRVKDTVRQVERILGEIIRGKKYTRYVFV